MNIEVGRTIKRLRQEKGVTQEELSEFLKVSCQAVSKWENDITMPDIALLPEIAVFFGVTIDSLFAIGRKDIFKRMERFYEGKIKPEEFEYAKKVLTQMIEDNPKDEEAYCQLQSAYFYYARQLKDKLREYGKKGIELNPFERKFHSCVGGSLVLDVHYGPSEGGDKTDYYYDFVKKHPEWHYGYCYLARSLIERMDIIKAEEVIKQGLSASKSNGYLEILLGDIENMKGNTEKALQIWDKIVKDDIDDGTVAYSDVLYHLAYRFIKHGFDEKGIELFNKSFESGKYKSNWSAMYSLAFYYDGKGDEDKAIESWERIIHTNENYLDLDADSKAEYNVWPKDMIKHLRDREKTKLGKKSD